MEDNILTFKVTSADAGSRADVWLLAQLAATVTEGEPFSRARVQLLMKEGYVERLEPDETPENNPAHKVRKNEVYEVTLPEVGEFELVGEDIPLEILYEDEHLIVLNKPAGLTVHPAPGNWSGTLVHALVHHCGAELSGINGVARPGIVHRLDKDTSGTMLVAKTDAAHHGLAKQLANHSLHRIYQALVRGTPMPLAGRIENIIGRHPTDRIKRAVVETNGKVAVTNYKVLERFGKMASSVELKLETGRTHQIRVHMAHLGNPLIGDPLYGSRQPLPGLAFKGLEDDAAQAPLQALLQNTTRQMLHAREIGFTHPVTGKALSFTSSLPEDMQALIQALKKAN